MCHEVFDTERCLNYVPAGEFDRSQENTDSTWAQRRGWVIASQRRIEDKYLRHCNLAVPVRRYTVLIADIIIADMWLFACRPLQRHPDSPISVKISHPRILHLAAEGMEKTLHLSVDATARPFRWISSIWVQWHALAVMIAELCVQTEGPTVERAWAVADTAFEETSRHVADSDKRRLWRPIKKLMNKAQAVRKKYLEDAAASLGSLPAGRAPSLPNQIFSWPKTQLSDVDMMQSGGGPNLLGEPSVPTQQQQLQQIAASSESALFNWDQLLATDSSDQMDYNNELDQMSWTNWETFIDDFQANRDFPPLGQEGTMPSSFNMW